MVERGWVQVKRYMHAGRTVGRQAVMLAGFSSEGQGVHTRYSDEVDFDRSPDDDGGQVPGQVLRGSIELCRSNNDNHSRNTNAVTS